MEEITISQIGAYGGCFAGAQAAMVIASVAAGNTRARLWVAPQAEGANAALLWDKGNNVFYVSGNLAAEEVSDEPAHLIATEIRQEAIREGLAHFSVCALGPSQEDVRALFQGVPLRKVHKTFYGLEKKECNAAAVPQVADVCFVPIDRALLGSDVDNLERVQAEIEWMWPSVERFCQQGFGYAARVGDSVVCWCTAEYVSHERCGIGIETLRGYQNKGLGTATAERLVDRCLQRGIKPHWECASANRASMRVAEKLGFERIEEATFWCGGFEA